MINAGKFNHRINIYSVEVVKDKNGFQSKKKTLVISPYANIQTTSGITLIINNSDFEKAYTKFTIRYPLHVNINRDMIIEYNNKEYSIEYLNNVNEDGILLEIQGKEVTH